MKTKLKKLFLLPTEWDSASFLLLLHILPPQLLKHKKKTQKISAAQAIDQLVVFHKVCTGPQYVI